MQQFTEMFNMLCNREVRFNGSTWGDSNSQVESDLHGLSTLAVKLISNDKSNELVECLKDRMEAPDVQKRLLAFWLLDRICQEVYNTLSSPQTELFIKTVEKQLYGLLRLITGGAEQPGIKHVCFNNVHEILKAWSAKRMFKPAIIANAVKQITGCMQTEDKKHGSRPNFSSYVGLTVGAGIYDKQQIEKLHHENNIPHEEEHRHENEVRRLTEKEKQARDLMEQQRSSQKREKLEKALRPVNEPEDGEFLEQWAKTVRQEQERERYANAEEDFWERWKRGTPIWRPEFPKGANGKALYGRQQALSLDEDSDEVMAGTPSSKPHSKRKKRPAESADKPPDRRYDNEVWIWELDALTGERLLWNIEGGGAELGNKLKEEMFEMADRMYFCQELDAEQPFHILEQQMYDDNRDLNAYDFTNDGGVQQKDNPLYRTLLAYRYRRVQQLYDHGLWKLLGEPEISKVNALFEEFKNILRKSEKSSCEGAGSFSPRRSWIEVALSCIQRIKQGGGRNVVICSAPLIASLAKCQLSGLAAEFPACTIYSGDTPETIAKCFEDIFRRWGADRDYHIVYDREGQASETWRDIPKVLNNASSIHFEQITAVDDVQGLIRCVNVPKKPRALLTNSLPAPKVLPGANPLMWPSFGMPPPVMPTYPPLAANVSATAGSIAPPTNGNWVGQVPTPSNPLAQNFLAPFANSGYDPRLGSTHAPSFFPFYQVPQAPQSFIPAPAPPQAYFMPVPSQYRA